jgi:hypothetical protein
VRFTPGGNTKKLTEAVGHRWGLIWQIYRIFQCAIVTCWKILRGEITLDFQRFSTGRVY